MTNRPAALGIDGGDASGAGVLTDAALTSFVVEHYGRLLGFARLICRDPLDAADAVQVGLEQAWRHRAALQGNDRLRAWLDRIVAREAVRLSVRRRSWLGRLSGPGVAWLDPRDPAGELTSDMTALRNAFVLSGFALEHVYGARLTSIGAVGAFARARVARIAPLFVAATPLTVAAAVAGGHRVDAVQVGANITGLFGLWQPGATQLAECAWSIGIELVFYAIFPIVVALRLGTRVLAVLALGALLVRLVWIEAVWPDGANFGRTWEAYTVVPSFLVFFVVGMLAARLAERESRGAGHVPFLVGCCLLRLVLAASALPVEQRDFFAGPLSIALVAATCLGVGVAAFGAPWQGLAARLATLLGDASYATYLLHPLVWGVLALAGLGIATLVVTPLLALAVNRWFEQAGAAADPVVRGSWTRAAARHGGDVISLTELGRADGPSRRETRSRSVGGVSSKPAGESGAVSCRDDDDRRDLRSDEERCPQPRNRPASSSPTSPGTPATSRTSSWTTRRTSSQTS